MVTPTNDLTSGKLALDGGTSPGVVSCTRRVSPFVFTPVGCPPTLPAVADTSHGPAGPDLRDGSDSTLHPSANPCCYETIWRTK
jgi:hypothetical protein